MEYCKPISTKFTKILNYGKLYDKIVASRIK